MSGPKPATLESRLLSWRMVDESTGCWLSSLAYRDEYKRITYKGRKQLIHRLSAYAFLGLPEDSDMQVNHKLLCPHKACFNPEHIYIGTAKQNSQDYSSSKTHCINGHELTPSNTYTIVLRHGPRAGSMVKNCRECGKLNARRYRVQN